MEQENKMERHFPFWFIRTRNVIYYILGFIEALLGLRLLFKILGASVGSSFVVMLYTITNAFLAPFSGIFGNIASRADSTWFILEPAVLVAMIIYAIIAFGVVSLIRIKALKEDDPV